jgi:hypothetical protein
MHDRHSLANGLRTRRDFLRATIAYCNHARPSVDWVDRSPRPASRHLCSMRGRVVDPDQPSASSFVAAAVASDTVGR